MNPLGLVVRPQGGESPAIIPSHTGWFPIYFDGNSVAKISIILLENFLNIPKQKRI